MSIKEIAFKLEELQITAEKVNDLQTVLWQAIYRGDITPESYEWAFMVLGDLTHELKNELSVVMHQAFEKLGAEKGK